MIRILKSLAIITAVVAIAGVGTYAWERQTEAISGITFAAGSLDLKIDSDPDPDDPLWVDSFDADFDQDGLEPGGGGSQIIDILSQGDTNTSASIRLEVVSSTENDRLTPEVEAGDTTPNIGELADNMRVRISYDADNNGSFDSLATNYDYTLAEYNANPNLLSLGQITSGTGIASIKLEWYIPANAGNEIMTDGVGIKVIFGLE